MNFHERFEKLREIYDFLDNPVNHLYADSGYMYPDLNTIISYHLSCFFLNINGLEISPRMAIKEEIIVIHWKINGKQSDDFLIFMKNPKEDSFSFEEFDSIFIGITPIK